jgi:hypothetical protein
MATASPSWANNIKEFRSNDTNCRAFLWTSGTFEGKTGCANYSFRARTSSGEGTESIDQFRHRELHKTEFVIPIGFRHCIDPLIVIVRNVHSTARQAAAICAYRGSGNGSGREASTIEVSTRKNSILVGSFSPRRCGGFLSYLFALFRGKTCGTRFSSLCTLLYEVSPMFVEELPHFLGHIQERISYAY